MIEKVCQSCGKRFSIKDCVAKTGRGKYCSRSCFLLGISGSNNYNWKGGTVKRMCDNCGKDFYIKPSQIAIGGGKYCGRKCYFEHKRKIILLRPPKAHKAKIKTIKCVCDLCGNEMFAYPKSIQMYSTHFCTKECYYKFKKESSKGHLNPNWRGGIRSKNSELRASDDFKKWRKEVFRLDKHTCRICGKRGGELHAHHITRFSWLIKNTPNNMWDRLNGITLCSMCHSLIHGRYIISRNRNVMKKVAP